MEDQQDTAVDGEDRELYRESQREKRCVLETSTQCTMLPYNTAFSNSVLFRDLNFLTSVLSCHCLPYTEAFITHGSVFKWHTDEDPLFLKCYLLNVLFLSELTHCLGPSGQ